MFSSFLKRLRGTPRTDGQQFEPLFSLAEVESFGRLPILQVLPFIPLTESSEGEAIGPGVGGLLANLLRRNLLLTRQVSVVGIEDTGYCLDPDVTGNAHDFKAQVRSNCDILITGRLKAKHGSESTLEIRILRPETQDQTLRISFTHARVADLAIMLAKEVATRLQLKLTQDIIESWRIGKPQNWASLCLAATCWESKDFVKLVGLTEARHVHSDALLPLSNSDDLELTRRGFALGTQQDPLNSQLLFCHFCAIWKGNVRHQPEAAQLLRRALQCAPGHGKSHMCLPHVTALTSENAPYILAHSQTGYQLLRTNAFALSNFCSYLKTYAPDDPRISQLFLEATRLDPESPYGYRDAIEYLLSRNKYYEALEFARALVRICTPPLAERTLYCFRQNPSVAAEIDRGTFDIGTFSKKYVDVCEKALGKG